MNSLSTTVFGLLACYASIEFRIIRPVWSLSPSATTSIRGQQKVLYGQGRNRHGGGDVLTGFFYDQLRTCFTRSLSAVIAADVALQIMVSATGCSEGELFFDFVGVSKNTGEARQQRDCRNLRSRLYLQQEMQNREAALASRYLANCLHARIPNG